MGLVLTEKMEKGRMRLMTSDDQKIVFVSGVGNKINAAAQSGAQSAQDFKGHGLGTYGVAHEVAYSEVTKLDFNDANGLLVVRYQAANGKSNSIEIKIRDKSKRQPALNWLGGNLKKHGLARSTKPVSAFSLLLGPVALGAIVAFLGGLMTLMQGGDVAFDPDQAGGSGRRQAIGRGVAVILNLIGDTLGFYGCLVVTIALLAAIIFYAWRRLSSRPERIVFASS